MPVSLKVRKDWLAASVGLYARPLKKRRPSKAKLPQMLGALGNHGRYQIIEVKVRGKPTLRYLPTDQIRDKDHEYGIAGNSSAGVYNEPTPEEGPRKKEQSND